MSMRKSEDRGMPLRPMNVEQIVEDARSFEYNPQVPLRYWLRTAGTLLKEAEIYEREGNEQKTYLLLFRHAELILSKLAKHPEAREPENRLALAQAKREVNRSFAKLEKLKPEINRRYERYESILQDRDTRQSISGASHREEGKREDDAGPIQPPFLNAAASGSQETIAAHDNKEFAVRIAHQEFKRRALARNAIREAGVSEEEERERRAAGIWGDWEKAYAQGGQHDTLSLQMQNVRLQLDGKQRGGTRNSHPRSLPASSSETSHQEYHYPSIPIRDVSHPAALSALPATTSHRLESRLPPVHASVSPSEKAYFTHDPPPRPAKHTLGPREGSAVGGDRPTLQSEQYSEVRTFRPCAYLENGSPLRTIFLPPDLRHRFLSIAEENTHANLETCGILCGSLISNALFISKLVIPEQNSTSDTCEMINESALFDYVDGEDLMVLGWIHTHPTQTCFMSSRDLHTHCGYQVMMAESVAIVCAPSKNDWGVFRLTDPPGMKSVLNCTQPGLFHPHAERNVYTDALRPGHVVEAKGLKFEVYDMRSKSKMHT